MTILAFIVWAILFFDDREHGVLTWLAFAVWWMS
jgi:hypothetical protein